jgi:niacin transporter
VAACDLYNGLACNFQDWFNFPMFKLSALLKFLGVSSKFIVLLMLAGLLKERYDSISMVIPELRWDTGLALLSLALHLPLFWTSMIAPLAFLIALSMASDVLIRSGEPAAFDQAMRASIGRIAGLLIFAGCAWLVLVPSLEYFILSGKLSVVLHFSLNDLAVALTGVLGRGFLFFK